MMPAYRKSEKESLKLVVTALVLSTMGMLMLLLVDPTWDKDALLGIVTVSLAGLGIGVLCAFNQKKGRLVAVGAIIIGLIGFLLSVAQLFEL